MLGPPRSQGAWGALPLVVDTSAWAHAHHPHVSERWTQALLADRVRISPLVRFEILLTPREGPSFDTLADRLSALRPAPLTAAVLRAAQDAMRTLAHRSADAQRVPIVEFESSWLAPAGSLS